MRLRIQVYVPPFFSNHHGNTRTHETEGGGRGGRTHADLSVPDHTPAWLLLLTFPPRPPPFSSPPSLPFRRYAINQGRSRVRTSAVSQQVSRRERGQQLRNRERLGRGPQKTAFPYMPDNRVPRTELAGQAHRMADHRREAFGISGQRPIRGADAIALILRTCAGVRRG